MKDQPTKDHVVVLADLGVYFNGTGWSMKPSFAQDMTQAEAEAKVAELESVRRHCTQPARTFKACLKTEAPAFLAGWLKRARTEYSEQAETIPMRIKVVRHSINCFVGTNDILPPIQMEMQGEIVTFIYEHGFVHCLRVATAMVIPYHAGGKQFPLTEIAQMCMEIDHHNVPIDMQVILHRDEDLLEL